MKFPFVEFFHLAQEMATQTFLSSSQEAILRTIISRAYYAAFILARNYLRDKEKKVARRGQNVHEYVINQFLNNPDPIRQQIGQNLNWLRLTRNAADYDDDFSRLPKKARRSLSFAKSIIDDLNSL